jgi:hypothetical protein
MIPMPKPDDTVPVTVNGECAVMDVYLPQTLAEDRERVIAAAEDRVNAFLDSQRYSEGDRRGILAALRG